MGKVLPAGKRIGESWELYDFPPGVVESSKEWVSSEISNGALAGRTLHWAVSEYGAELHGDVPLINGEQFPILMKFLDAREALSLQVHPPLSYAREHPGAHLKTEAWYVVANEPGAKLYRGLRRGVTKEQFRAALGNGSVMEMVHAMEVKPGQSVYLPSGTVHALGAGILVAEVQTPSDTTFRVWDFGRVENGRPRKLHVEEALECIDFSGAPEAKQRRAHTVSFFTAVTRLVTSEHFVVEKVRFSEGFENPVPYDQPVVWMVLEGEAEVSVSGVKEATRFRKGETVLLPARMKDPVLRTLSDCVWLEVTFPTRAEIG